jgi:hypothetical protein
MDADKPITYRARVTLVDGTSRSWTLRASDEFCARVSAWVNLVDCGVLQVRSIEVTPEPDAPHMDADYFDRRSLALRDMVGSHSVYRGSRSIHRVMWAQLRELYVVPDSLLGELQ